MKNRKGFTLIELMVVILIVAILAAVAIPILRGRIDAAKWSEGRAGAGTMSVAIRATEAEGVDPLVLANYTDPNDWGFADLDLAGTYFTQECYAVDYTSQGNWAITVTAALSTISSGVPSNPLTMTLTVTDGAGAWSQTP